MKEKAQKANEAELEKQSDTTTPTELGSGKNAVTSNSPPKERVKSEVEEDVDTSDKRPSPSTSGPKGTEELGSDEGPGGTGW